MPIKRDDGQPGEDERGAQVLGNAEEAPLGHAGLDHDDDPADDEHLEQERDDGAGDRQRGRGTLRRQAPGRGPDVQQDHQQDEELHGIQFRTGLQRFAAAASCG